MVIKKRKKILKRKITRKARKNPKSFFDLTSNLENEGWKFSEFQMQGGTVLISPDKKFNIQIFNDGAYLSLIDNKGHIIIGDYEISNFGEKELDSLSENLKTYQKMFKRIKSFIEE